MDIYQSIKTRRSVRTYKDKAIPEDLLNQILDGARLAPSAHNAQPWKLVVVKEQATREKLAQAAGQSYLSQAPVIIAAVALNTQTVMSNNVPGYAVDLAIIIDHITLLAAAEGLGTCWVGAFDQEETKKILNIPQENKIVALLPIGYPNDEGGSKIRKNLNEIVCFEKFQE